MDVDDDAGVVVLAEWCLVAGMTLSKIVPVVVVGSVVAVVAAHTGSLKT